MATKRDEIPSPGGLVLGSPSPYPQITATEVAHTAAAMREMQAAASEEALSTLARDLAEHIDDYIIHMLDT